jgi:hypothetical protein
MNQEIKVIDNFLQKEDFVQLKSFFCSEYFPWYFNSSKSGISEDEDDHFQFIHNFYFNYMGNTVQSNLLEYLFPLIKKINPISLIRVKANLTTKTIKNEVYGFHTDVNPKEFIKTGVFYLQNTNGGTIFDDDNVIECVENRFVYFPSGLLHSGISATDTKSRIVINFNYI